MSNVKIRLLAAFLLLGGLGKAQCPNVTVQLTGGHCVGDTLLLLASGRIDQIIWYNGTQPVKTVTGAITPSPATIVAGGNGSGNAANQFYLPVQIYVDGKGDLYIADENNWRIQKFPAGSTSTTNGNTIIQPALPNSSTGPAHIYSGLYLDPQGNIYVEDGGAIERWAPASTHCDTVAFLTHVGSNTNLYAGAQIFVDAARNVYIPEPGLNRVQKWVPGATTGVTVAGGNGAGPAANQLNEPSGCYVDNAGNIYIADTQNDRIQKWAPGATAGITVAGGNGEGSAANQLDMPKNCCVDGAGNIYIADTYNQRVQLWAPGAPEGVTIVGGQGQGDASNQLYYPANVFLDSKGYLYTCDTYNERILKSLPTLVYAIDLTLLTNTAGTYSAITTSDIGCTATTNSIVVQPTTYSTMQLSPSANPVCAGDSIAFTATLNNTGLTPAWQWLVNGKPAGGNSPAYVDLQPSGGDRITCTANDQATCAVATADTITVTVIPSPAIPPDQAFSLSFGQSILLEPIITGAADHYSWNPAAGLSDTAIKNPLASPSITTVYTLQATGTDGCTTEGTIKVQVFIPLRMPNAFTPNGDGRNDVFYVLGGPPGLVIKEFAVYDRHGQCFFQVHDVPAGDPAFGWNGRVQDKPAPTGTYIYLISAKMPDGTTQVFKGTVQVIR